MSLGTRYHGRGKLHDSALAAPSTGVAIQNLNAANYALLTHVAVGDSALFTIDVSPDNDTWIEQGRYTALTTVGTAQLAGYFPFVRSRLITGYDAATATVWYTPGLA